MTEEHLHPAQDEHFEIRAGSMAARVGGEEAAYGPGEKIDIPRETVHAMWNAGDEPAMLLWQTRPALRTRA
jgi:mannose-6-phosphate isomerase-like protein (cupin superfamily)